MPDLSSLTLVNVVIVITHVTSVNFASLPGDSYNFGHFSLLNMLMYSFMEMFCKKFLRYLILEPDTKKQITAYTTLQYSALITCTCFVVLWAESQSS